MRHLILRRGPVLATCLKDCTQDQIPLNEYLKIRGGSAFHGKSGPKWLGGNEKRGSGQRIVDV